MSTHTTRWLRFAVGGLLGTTIACGRPVRAVMTLTTAHTPRDVKLSYEDVDRFSALLRDLDTNGDTTVAIRRYLTAGSAGLDAYAKKYAVNDSSLRAAIRRRPDFYRLLRDLPERLRASEPGVRAGMDALERLYPGSVFPTVYYVVGTGRAGGQASRQGVLIGADVYAASADSSTRAKQSTPRHFHTLDDLAALVVHETVHFNQFSNAPITYSRQWSNLARALKEGSADFVAELATGRHISRNAHIYGDEHEVDQWQQFAPTLSSSVTGDWFFAQPTDGRPSDLGYYLGYRIVRSFYEHAATPARALESIMTLHDYQQFMQRSGYRPSTSRDSAARAAARDGAVIGSSTDQRARNVR